MIMVVLGVLLLLSTQAVGGSYDLRHLQEAEPPRCPAGLVGELCSTCDASYYRGINGDCQQCDANRTVARDIGILSIYWIAGALVMSCFLTQCVLACYSFQSTFIPLLRSLFNCLVALGVLCLALRNQNALKRVANIIFFNPIGTLECLLFRLFGRGAIVANVELIKAVTVILLPFVLSIIGIILSVVVTKLIYLIFPTRHAKYGELSVKYPSLINYLESCRAFIFKPYNYKQGRPSSIVEIIINTLPLILSIDYLLKPLVLYSSLRILQCVPIEVAPSTWELRSLVSNGVTCTLPNGPFYWYLLVGLLGVGTTTLNLLPLFFVKELNFMREYPYRQMFGLLVNGYSRRHLRWEIYGYFLKFGFVVTSFLAQTYFFTPGLFLFTILGLFNFYRVRRNVPQDGRRNGVTRKFDNFAAFIIFLVGFACMFDSTFESSKYLKHFVWAGVAFIIGMFLYIISLELLNKLFNCLIYDVDYQTYKVSLLQPNSCWFYLSVYENAFSSFSRACLESLLTNVKQMESIPAWYMDLSVRYGLYRSTTAPPPLENITNTSLVMPTKEEVDAFIDSSMSNIPVYHSINREEVIETLTMFSPNLNKIVVSTGDIYASSTDLTFLKQKELQEFINRFGRRWKDDHLGTPYTPSWRVFFPLPVPQISR